MFPPTLETPSLTLKRFSRERVDARWVGMTTVWIEDEEPYRQPDHTIDTFASLPPVLERIQESR